ncbi:MAG TPA: Crp/Fnr family transcriptional regulator [Candidatus Acidoferrales bacterium]|nr:Crp/Fnr family transcriptional regulator [Candidatus Acidoferrales bacterium]
MEPDISENSRVRFDATLRGLGFPRPVIGELIDNNPMVRYSKNSTIYTSGSIADIVFAIVSGWVKVYHCSGGRRIMTHLAGPGEVVGYIERLDDKCAGSRMFQAQTLSQCSVVLLTRERLTHALDRLDKPVLIAAIERLNAHWSSYNERFVSMMLMSFRERLEFALGEIARDFGVRDARGILLRPELGHEELAEMIGSSRPMVTRILGELAHEGLVTKCGRHIVMRERPRVEAAA